MRPLDRAFPLFVVFVVLAGLMPIPIGAQSAPGHYPAAEDETSARVDELHMRLDPSGELALADSLLQADPTNYEYLWRAARAAVSLGMLAAVPADARRHLDRAEAYARDATDINPEGLMGHHFVSVALGLQALSEGVRTRVPLAEEVRSEAESVIALDSTYAGGYHVLGKWHAEVKRLGFLSGFVASRIMRGDGFGDASWEEAERLMRRAIDLDPGGMMHHLELARILMDTGRQEQAREELTIVLEMPVREPIDPLHQQRAQELLRDLEG